MLLPEKGIYAITQTAGKSPAHILSDVEACLKGGVQLLQYRNKERQNYLELARDILDLCRQFQVPLIINDDIELAKNISADGVHLGKDDGDIPSARALLGTSTIIGVSCYNDIERAKQAEKAGASYVAFGRFFASDSKPLTSPAKISTLSKAKLSIHLPIVAIGGILPENATQLLTAGADILAVINGIFSHDPEQSSRNYVKLLVRD